MRHIQRESSIAVRDRTESRTLDADGDSRKRFFLQVDDLTDDHPFIIGSRCRARQSLDYHDVIYILVRQFQRCQHLIQHDLQVFIRHAYRDQFFHLHQRRINQELVTSLLFHRIDKLF